VSAEGRQHEPSGRWGDLFRFMGMNLWNLNEAYPNFFAHLLAVVVAAAITGISVLAGRCLG